MKKAAQKTPTSVDLGTKRACPKCGTKFYDFKKEDLTCPKCEAEFNVNDIEQGTRIIPEVKKPAKPEKVDETLLQAEELGHDDTENFESVDDLADEDDDLVDDLDVNEEEQESF